jgi:thioredoxin-related protein
MKNIFRKVQFLSNISVILIALLFGFVVIKQSLIQPTIPDVNATSKPVDKPGPSSPAVPPNRAPAVGMAVPLENVNWKDNKKTLVLYISATCRYCTESVPFYQRLIKENIKNGVKVIAVLPQESNEAKEYLASKNVDITQIYKASFGSIGVTATPTLLLVDASGVITDSWRGKLPPDKEEEVISKLFS